MNSSRTPVAFGRADRRWRWAPALLLAVLAGCDEQIVQPPVDTSQQAVQQAVAPLTMAQTNGIPDRYVVVFREDEVMPNAGEVAEQMVRQHNGQLHYTYENTIRGFAATLTPQAVEALRRNPTVAYVEQDAMAFPSTIQTPATWGIDRVDQRDLPLNNQYRYGPTGAGVRVYVIDTGIRTAHTQFSVGRASVGADFVGDGQNGQDCNGHGTHVSGTIAGTTYGIAKGARVVSVRVFGCTGGAAFSTIIAAVDWVRVNHISPAVTNMSLGGGAHAATDAAVQALYAAGVPVVVSAGNDNIDACLASPARAPNAITIGSTTITDARSSFSNWGTCLDLFAPGSSITSAWWTSNNATNTISGTSMASPHVAGAAALYRQLNPAHTPLQVRNYLVAVATLNKVTGAGVGSPNRLLYTSPPRPFISFNTSLLHYSFLRPILGSSMPGAVPQDSASIPKFTAISPKPKASPVANNVDDGEMHISTAHGNVATQPVRLMNTGDALMDWTSSIVGATWASRNPIEGTLPEGSSTRIDVTANASALGFGTFTGTFRVSDPESTNPLYRRDIPIIATVATPSTLHLGTAVTGLAGAGGSFRYWVLDVPAGIPDLSIAISPGAGATGDADLYVRYGDSPSRSQWDCRPYSAGNSETCMVPLPAPGTYYIMLHGFSAFTNVDLLATAGGPPLAPTNLAGLAVTANQINLTWDDNASNESSFTLQRRHFVGGVWSAWANLVALAPNTEAFNNGGLAAGIPYQYRIRANNGAGSSQWANSPSITTIPIPAAPTNLAGVAAPTRINLTWTDNASNEANFRIERREWTGAMWTAWVLVVSRPANTVSWLNTLLNPSTSYQYRIQACNAGGCSGFNTSGVITTPPNPPNAPSNVDATTVSSTQVILTWTDNASNEANFTLQRRQFVAGVWGAYGTIASPAANATNYHDNTVVAGGTWQYQLRACNAGGCSVYAPSDVVTTP